MIIIEFKIVLSDLLSFFDVFTSYQRVLYIIYCFIHYYISFKRVIDKTHIIKRQMN